MPSRTPVLILVGLGHLMKSDRAGYVSPAVIEQRIKLVESLAAFRGDTACWLRDSNYANGQADPMFHKRLLAFGQRMRKFVIVDYDTIDERTGSRSSLALTQGLILESHVASHQHSILITGAWHDSEDGDVDLMRYAFTGMGFRTRIDASAARRPVHGLGRPANWLGDIAA